MSSEKGEYKAVAREAIYFIEKVAIIFGLLIGALALWQFYDERDERQLSRDANFISAFTACSDLDQRILSKFQELSAEERRQINSNVSSATRSGVTEIVVNGDMSLEDFGTAILLRDILMRRRSTFGERCNRIFDQNRILDQVER